MADNILPARSTTMKDMKEEENFHDSWHERGAALLLSDSADSLHVCVCRIGCSATQGEMQGEEQGEEQGAERQAASLSIYYIPGPCRSVQGA